MHIEEIQKLEKLVGEIEKEIARRINRQMIKYNMPIRVVPHNNKKIDWWKWVERLRISYVKRKRIYRCIATNRLRWKDIERWNLLKFKEYLGDKYWDYWRADKKGRWKLDPLIYYQLRKQSRKKWIYSFFGRKMVRWSKLLEKAHKERIEGKKELKKIREKSREIIADLEKCVGKLWQEEWSGLIDLLFDDRFEEVIEKVMAECIKRMRKRGLNIKKTKDGWALRKRKKRIIKLTTTRLKRLGYQVDEELKKVIKVWQKVKKIKEETRQLRRKEKKVRNLVSGLLKLEKEFEEVANVWWG